MEQETQQILDQLKDIGAQAQTFVESLVLPSRLMQIGIFLALIIIAQAFKTVLGPPIYTWMHSLEGRPKQQLRLLLILHRRMRLIVFVILTWVVIFFIREVLNAFPSRTYLLNIVATVSLALLVVSLATRVIRNTLLRKTVMWSAWIYVTLYFTGSTDEAARLLERIALELGDFRLSLLWLIKALAVFGALFFGARGFSGMATRQIEKNAELSPSARVLTVKFAQASIYATAVFLTLKAIGFDLSGLAYLSGAIGIGIGLGLQKVVSNLFSGVIILMDKSIKPGDVISLGETFGWINALGARYVSVVTRDGEEYLIPNEDLITSRVINWSHSNEFVRLDIKFGTSYGDDPHHVRGLAVEAAKSVDRVLMFKPPVCHVIGFGDSSVDFILRFWIKDPTDGLTNVRGTVYLALWDTFRENGISFPFPQREVRLLDRGTAPDRSQTAD